MPSGDKGRVVLGTIVAAHGIRGQVRVRPFTAAPGGIAAYGPVLTDSGRTLTLTNPRPSSKGQVIASVEGIQDRTAAEALAGQSFSVARDRLPPPSDPDEFYQADLLGLEAVDADGKALGRVTAVHDFGAGPLLEVSGLELSGPDRGPRLVPFRREVALSVDLKAGRIVLALTQEAAGGEG